MRLDENEDTFFVRFTDDPYGDAGDDHLTGFRLSSTFQLRKLCIEIQEIITKYANREYPPVLFRGRLVASEEFDTFSDVTVIKILTSTGRWEELPILN